MRGDAEVRKGPLHIGPNLGNLEEREDEISENEK